MTTATKLTSHIVDAVKSNPAGFTLNVETGVMLSHGIAVGGYHADHGFTAPDWLRFSNGEAMTFEMLQTAVEESWDAITACGWVGGWLQDGVLVLDIVQLFDCIACTVEDADASPILEGSRLHQEAVGWLCPSLPSGYKTIRINF